ncbi:hypothetical protein SynA1560_00905 [Synechococcus sp. A15-60]|nr:hypothetical protein SynA1560_00905 [Synechococcus sp. A15-60]
MVRRLWSLVHAGFNPSISDLKSGSTRLAGASLGPWVQVLG